METRHRRADDVGLQLHADRNWGRIGRRALGVVLVVAVAAPFAPTAGEARPTQEDPTSASDAQFNDSAIVDIPVDVAAGESSDVIGTLDDIKNNVARQLGDLEAADSAVDTAQTELDQADEAVTETETHIDGLVADSDDVVTNAYVNPPRDAILDTLAADSANDAAIKSALLSMQAEDDAATLAELDEARGTLEVERNAQAEVAAQAQQKRAEKEAQRADLEAATSQQTDFVIAVSNRLDSQLAEAAAVARIDPAMAETITREQSALAAKLREIAEAEAYKQAVEFLKTESVRLEAEAAAQRRREEEAAAAAAAAEAAKANATAGPASGSLGTVNCPAGGTITVDSGITAALQDLLDDAAAAGVSMCGGGWRSPDEQIALRRAHCGPTDYDIYEAPASACSPPTARPGTSLHEQGLAIDFTCNGGGVISSSSSPCFVWMSNHAAEYGFYNLPSERWHWSTTGG